MSEVIPEISPHSSPRIYAGFGRRFVAQTIDALLISIVTFSFQSILGQNMFSILASINSPEKLENLRASPVYITANIVSYIIYAIYLILFWVYYDGATPGKRLLAIRIVRENGQKITLPIAVVRIIGMVLSGLPLGLGYFWIIWDKNKQSWHDKLAKTYVVRTEAQTKTFPIVFLFIASLLFHGLLIGTGFYIGFLASRSTIQKRIQTRQSVQTYKKAGEELSPQAKVHFDRSQELFVQMREASNDLNKVRTLNDENIAELKKALEIEPNNARLWSELGSAYTWISTAGKLEDGLAAYGKAEELEPENALYVTNVGDMLIRLGKYQDAILELQKALRISTNYAYPEYLIGVAYKNLKIYDEARTHLEEAIQIYTKTNTEGQFDDEILLAQQQLANMPQ